MRIGCSEVWRIQWSCKIEVFTIGFGDPLKDLRDEREIERQRYGKGTLEQVWFWGYIYPSDIYQ
jgi:hypothetical protein